MSSYQDRLIVGVVRSQVATISSGGSIPSSLETIRSSIASEHTATRADIQSKAETILAEFPVVGSKVESQHNLTVSKLTNRVNSRIATTETSVNSRFNFVDAQIGALQNNVDHSLNMPTVVEIEKDASYNVRIYLYNYDSAGQMEDLDTNGAKITIKHQNGTYFVESNHTTAIASVLMTKDATKSGVYYYDFMLLSSLTPETAIVEVEAIESSISKWFGKTMTLVDNAGIDGVVQSQHNYTRSNLNNSINTAKVYLGSKVDSEHGTTRTVIGDKVDAQAGSVISYVDSRHDSSDLYASSLHQTTRTYVQGKVDSQHTETKNYLYEKIYSNHNASDAYVQSVIESQLALTEAAVSALDASTRTYIQTKLDSRLDITEAYLHSKIVSNAGAGVNIDSRLDITDSWIYTQHETTKAYLESKIYSNIFELGLYVDSRLFSQDSYINSRITTAQTVINTYTQTKIKSQHDLTRAYIDSEHTTTKTYVQAKVDSQHTTTKAYVDSRITTTESKLQNIEGIAVRKATFVDRPFFGSGSSLLNADPTIFEVLVGSTVSNTYAQIGGDIEIDTPNTGTKTITGMFIDASMKAQVTLVDGSGTGKFRLRAGASYGTSVALTDEMNATTTKTEFNRSGAIMNAALEFLPIKVYLEGKVTSGADILNLWGLSSTEITITYSV